jgi:hypothetical protein
MVVKFLSLLLRGVSAFPTNNRQSSQDGKPDKMKVELDQTTLEAQFSRCSCAFRIKQMVVRVAAV